MKLSKTGKIVGAVLLIGGIVAVVVIRRDSSGTELVVPPRPLKTMEIGAEALTTTTALPGRVAAGDEVTMSFNASGTLIELPVKEGDKVKKGQLLAQMDQRDAKNQVDAAVAELQRAAAQLDRMRIAAEAKAVSLQELSNAEATYAIAVARQNIAQKALEDTVLLASFDGVIARVMVKNFETVQSLQPIVSLQDLSGIEISASVPEYRVARLRPRQGDEKKPRYQFNVVFDFLPGREFSLTFKEFTMEADQVTQTFTAKFEMPSPPDVNILPGMACTVILKPLVEEVVNEVQGFDVPLNAVVIDGVGQYYVWLIQPSDGELYKAERRNVTVGRMDAEMVLITSGLEKGQRIALAGVHVLREGTLVRLLKPTESVGQ